MLTTILKTLDTNVNIATISSSVTIPPRKTGATVTPVSNGLAGELQILLERSQN